MSNELLFLLHCIVIGGSVFWGVAHSFGVLLSVLGLQLIVANIFVTKQIALFGLLTTGSEAFIVGGMYGMGLIQEYYGEQRARQTILFLLIAVVLFIVLSQFHLLYEPVAGNEVSGALAKMLQIAPRTAFASGIAYLISSRVHLWLRALLQGNRKRVAWREAVALIGGQVADTVAFAVVGLYGVVASLPSVMVVSMLIKLITMSVMSPLIAMAHSYLPQVGKKGA